MICILEWECFERCSTRPVVLNDPKAEKSMQIREIKIKNNMNFFHNSNNHLKSR